MKFNINNHVRVRLNDLGRRIHREKFASVFAGTMFEYRPPHEDAEGWSKWQLWDLMETFGDRVCLGMPLPFECEIEIVEASSLSS